MAVRMLPVAESERSIKNVSREPQAFVERLRRLYDGKYGTEAPSSRVYLTGRRPGRHLGWYERRTRSIHVNDDGLTDYAMRAVLIHEYGHHLQFSCHTREGGRQVIGPGSAHGPVFKLHHWRLRRLAHEAGLLCPLEKQDMEIGKVVQQIHGLRRHGGKYVLEVGKQLAAARERCQQIGESFEVFLQDCVAFDRTTAYDYIRAFRMNMPPELNFTTMRFLMRIKDERLREKAKEDAVAGIPLAILRLRYGKPKGKRFTVVQRGNEEELISALTAEKSALRRRLAEIDKLIQELTSRASLEQAACKGSRTLRMGDVGQSYTPCQM